jgi:hypothetical protein
MLGKGAITFQELFQMKEFQGVQVLSGSSMQEKLITGAHVVEITDSGSWIRPGTQRRRF